MILSIHPLSFASLADSRSSYTKLGPASSTIHNSGLPTSQSPIPSVSSRTLRSSTSFTTTLCPPNCKLFGSSPLHIIFVPGARSVFCSISYSVCPVVPAYSTHFESVSPKSKNSVLRALVSAGGTLMQDKLVSRNGKRTSIFSECRRGNSVRVFAASGQVAMILAMKDEGNRRFSEKETILPTALPSKVLTLPTVLTLGRVAAIPVLLFVFYSSEWWATAAAASIFVMAAITDWLDGYLARKMGSKSAFGAFLDPVADKLMVATTLVLLCTKPLMASWAAAHPWLIPLPATAIIGREITMSAVREWAAVQGGDLRAAVAVNNLGKWKTASQMVALTVLLATRDADQNGTAILLAIVGIIMLYISAGLALWSLVVYMKGIWRVLIK